MEDGRIITGVNVENASYGLTICAERKAVGKAIAEGYRKILAVSIATDNTGSPCSACRQQLPELAGDVPVWMPECPFIWWMGRETAVTPPSTRSSLTILVQTI